MKPAILFLATFLLGAVVAFATRTALHNPYAEPVSKSEISNPQPAPAPADPHAGHALKSEISNLKSDGAAVVNTVCAICGMDVNPALKPATYQGKLIGFGCAACPPQFAKDPDRYGPSALRNEVVKN